MGLRRVLQFPCTSKKNTLAMLNCIATRCVSACPRCPMMDWYSQFMPGVPSDPDQDKALLENGPRYRFHPTVHPFEGSLHIFDVIKAS